MSLNFKCFLQSKVTQEFRVHSKRKPIFDLRPNIVLLEILAMAYQYWMSIIYIYFGYENIFNGMILVQKYRFCIRYIFTIKRQY